MDAKPEGHRFWAAFEEVGEKLREQVVCGRVSAAYEHITRLLVECHYPYVVELTSDDDEAILIFTPESDPELATVVDAFVAAAPEKPGWKIFTRRQRRPVEDAFAMLHAVYDVDASDARFSVARKRNGLHVVMHTRVAEILGEPEKEGFVSFFLEHAVGEAAAMAVVRGKSVAPRLPSGQGLAPEDLVATILDAAT